MKSCIDYKQLKQAMWDQGYVLEAGPNRKYVAVRSIHSKKATRTYRLGEEYELPAIAERIEQNRYRYARDFSFQRYKPVKIDRKPVQHYRCVGSIKAVRKTGGLRSLYIR